MSDDITQRLKNREVVPISIELLQPLQVGLCDESLDELRRTPNKYPIFVFPIENGRYAIMDGTHRTFDGYEAGKTEINSRLYLRKPVDATTGLELNLSDEAIDYFEKSYDEKKFYLPHRLDFIMGLAKITHIKDLKERKYPLRSILNRINKDAFNGYLTRISIKPPDNPFDLYT
jgi:hypothetical protein